MSPLIELEPPSTRPRGILMLRPFMRASGSVSNIQLTWRSNITLPKPIGMWIQRLLSRPPDSSSSTRLRPDSVSRLASTHPADPAPTMM
jgi:hypothetical protein